MNEGRADDSTHGNSDFKGVGINIGRGGRHGVVHILVAEEGVDFIDQVEAHELMLEVVHEEVVENNYLRQQCKTLSVVLEIFNDKVYNNFFLAEALFPDLQIFQNIWVWDYHLGIHLLWTIILAFNSGEQHQTHNIGAHRQMHNNGAHH
ncbi:unnamed protein product [Brassica oleracea var. botrytis]